MRTDGGGGRKHSHKEPCYRSTLNDAMHYACMSLLIVSMYNVKCCMYGDDVALNSYQLVNDSAVLKHRSALY